MGAIVSRSHGNVQIVAPGLTFGNMQITNSTKSSGGRSPATEENNQTTISVRFSDENMLVSVDPMKKQNMSTRDRDALITALEFRLLGAKGHLRSEFQRITYSDYLNLLNHASSCFRNLNVHNLPWKEVVEELLSIVKEYQDATSKHGNSDDVLSQVLQPSLKPKCEADDDHNSEEQHLRGLINNQIKNVSGDFNGSIIVVGGDNFYPDRGEQHLRGLFNNQTGNVSGSLNGSIFNHVQFYTRQ